MEGFLERGSSKLGIFFETPLQEFFFLVFLRFLFGVELFRK